MMYNEFLELSGKSESYISYNLHFAIDDLEERVNHAWQDDEE